MTSLPLGWTAGPLPDDAVELGRLGEAWGIKGWLKVLPHNPDPQVLMAARQWWLQPPVPPFDRSFRLFEGAMRVQWEDIKPHADTLVVRLEGVPDRNLAEQLKGARISVARSEFPTESDPDEFYWVDLEGLEVVNREGIHLGTVSHLLATGPTSVLVVVADDGDRKQERLIPFVSAYVDRVDRTLRRITVDWQLDY